MPVSDTNTAVTAFSALGHSGRLSVFRMMMRFAPRPVRPTEIADALGLKPNTLSGYLSDLAQAGLVRVEREGRALNYSVDLGACEGLVDYLVNDCCRGRPEVCPDAKRPALPYKVLFLCSGNSARSIFAEAILRDLGAGRFDAYSAGTRPATSPHLFALELLKRNGHAVTGLHSKDITQFQHANAPKFDFVFTVCDRAAREECVPWPSHPLTAHWGVEDPVAATGTDAEKGLAFARAYDALYRRIAAFTALSVEDLDRMSLQRHIDDIAAN